MKAVIKILLILAAWSIVALLITTRLFFIDNASNSSAGFYKLFVDSLPGWLLWAGATPLILASTRLLPLSRKKWPGSLIIQVLCAALFILLYGFAFTILDAALSGATPDPDRLAERSLQHVRAHWPFILSLYALVAAISYAVAAIWRKKPEKKQRAFENAILIKTNYGYVLVEIEKFQYVKDGGRRIMFHTGSTKHLNRNRVALQRGELVEEHRYRPDRRIVIDLAKIRRAEQTGPDRYIFHIGYSHEVYLNRDYYQKLGGWLPPPKVSYSQGSTRK